MDEKLRKGEAVLVGDSTPGFDPSLNHNVISLIKQEDGNWKGYMFKNGNGVQPDGVIEVRDIGPETVLQLLLTHD